MHMTAHLMKIEKNKFYKIAYEDKMKIVNFIEDKAKNLIDRKHGLSLYNFNTYKEKLLEMQVTKNKFIVGTVIGWAAATILTLIALFK